MKNFCLSFILFLITFHTLSQTNYEKGYIVNNTNERIECYIKNEDWVFNPKKIEYKLFPESSVEFGDIINLKEFGLYNGAVFQRYQLNMDIIDNLTQNLNFERNENLKESIVFLKLLVNGPATLYGYFDNTSRIYFYKTVNNQIEQLIYKKFLTQTNLGDYVSENNKFKQQLFLNLKCDNVELSDIEKLKYYENDLIKFFRDYNNCIDPTTISETTSAKNTGKFNLNIRPGVNFGELKSEIFEVDPNNNNNFKNTSLRIGLELEYIFGFNNNKWAMFFEPTYQNFRTENTLYFDLIKSNFEYSSIELPIGIRHYFFINDKSKIFLNIAYVGDIALKNHFYFTYPNGFIDDKDFKSNSNILLGIGFKFKNRLGFEARYFTPRSFVRTPQFNTSNTISGTLSTFSLIFSYNIL